MGHTMNVDSECVVCKRITDRYCDACGCFICENHVAKQDDKIVSYYLCPNCFKSNRKKVTMIKGEIWRGFTTK
jgi:hypothetical protein